MKLHVSPSNWRSAPLKGLHVKFLLWHNFFSITVCLVQHDFFSTLLDFQPFQQNSSSKIPQFGLSYCALKEEFTNIIHGHNSWHDHAFLDGMSSTKIHTTCLEEQPKRQSGRTDLIKAYSKAQMVMKIRIILACVIFRLGKKKLSMTFCLDYFSWKLHQIWYTHKF